VPSPTLDTKPVLTETDLAALQTVFETLGDAFTARDPQKVEALLIGGSDRTRIVESVKREFAEARYSEFRVIGPVEPDYRLTQRRHSVQVRLQFQLVYLHEDRQADAPRVVQNDQYYEFVVHRNDKGQFRIVSSSFFDNLGRHSGGLSGILANGMLMVTSALTLLAFWIWMASYVLWMRPRRPVWRFVVFWLPPFGAVAFFFFCWIPRWWSGAKNTGRR
jgi:hypothetical protein